MFNYSFPGRDVLLCYVHTTLGGLLSTPCFWTASSLSPRLSTQIREQNRQDVKSAGPQSQLLASVIAEKSRSPVQQMLPPPAGEASLPSGSAVPGAGRQDP